MGLSFAFHAIADNPLGMPREAGEVEAVDDADGAVAAAAAEDGADAVVVEELLQERGAVAVGACKLVVAVEEPVGHEDVKSPGLERLDGRGHLVGRHLACCRCQCHPVAGFQVGDGVHNHRDNVWGRDLLCRCPNMCFVRRGPWGLR